MSRSAILLAVVCGLTVGAAPEQVLIAQDKSQASKEDDSQQRGRFLRRLREDIRSLTGTDDEDKDKAQQRDGKDARTPTLAARPKESGFQPIQGRYDGVRIPEPTQPNQSNAGRVPGFRLSDQLPSNRETPTAPDLANNPPRKGFGLTLEEKGDQLVVDALQRNGNAAEADFRRGDVVLEIGGVPVKTITEFDEITRILSQGDQIEVSISRSGKEEKKLLQLGSVPDTGSVAAPDGLRGPSLVASGPRDFVPDFAPEPDARFTRQLPGSAVGSGLGGSDMEQVSGNQQMIQNSAAINQMQETIRRQQEMIEQLQKELQGQQGSNRRRNQ